MATEKQQQTLERERERKRDGNFTVLCHEHVHLCCVHAAEQFQGTMDTMHYISVHDAPNVRRI